jgi:F420-dependent oxidoreductase-like protein
MTNKIGIVANQSEARATLDLIERADALGIPMAWLIQAGMAPYSLGVLAAAAVRTRQIGLGTAIVPIWARHPLGMAQAALAVNALAPGRLRLGIGPSGPGVAQSYGMVYERPLAHLREYATILRTLFTQGEVRFEGQYYHAQASLRQPGQAFQPLNIHILASALRSASFRLCGEVMDGAISWVCPPAYLRDAALPALQAGARQAGRSAPPLIAHVPIVVHENIDEARQAVRATIGVYPRLPHYQRMFTEAGFPEAAQGVWSDAMIDALVAYGDETAVQRRVAEIFAMGISEIAAHLVPAGPDREASLARALRTVADLAR